MANPIIYVWHLAVVRPWPVVFDEAAAEVAAGGDPPAIMLITGHGLKKGVAPLRDTVLEFLKRMGVSGVRVARNNGGTLIVPYAGLKEMIRRVLRRRQLFDVYHWHAALVDPRGVPGAGVMGL